MRRASVGAIVRLIPGLTLGLIVVFGSLAPAGAVKFRRPYTINVSLGYGFDNNYSAAGCKDWNCGGTCYNTHTGSDFPLGVGNDVVAGAPGTVIYVNQGCPDYGYVGNPCGGKCGNYVKLRHADNSETIYCHMLNGSVVVSNGQSVSCGQKLGRSASSGSSSGPHLHFGWTPASGGGRDDPFKGSCSGSSAWVSQGSYPGKPSTTCEVQCQCTPGQSQNQACGNCGSRKRTCQSNCQWGGWGSCGGQGACAPGQNQSQGCGNCGTRKRTCNSSCGWGSWSTCTGQGPCAPGATDVQGCGNCGEHDRTCGNDCQWGGFSACTGEGECAAGAVETEACCDCGERSRSCSGTCAWDDWSGCAGPDPEGDPECDTGKLGDCAAGVVRCQQGCLTCTDVLQPSPERCDGRDNDCDGPVDEDATEMGDAPPEFAAELVDLSAPSSLPLWSSGVIWAEFRNVGERTWAPGELTLRALDPDGALSALWPEGQWPAWDVAALVSQEVPPGGTVRLQFPVLLSGDDAGFDETDTRTRFQMEAVGTPIACPSPGFEVSVVPLSRERAESEGEPPMRVDIAPLDQRAGPEVPSGGDGAGGDGAGGDGMGGGSSDQAVGGSTTSGCTASSRSVPGAGTWVVFVVMAWVAGLARRRRRIAHPEMGRVE